ncbi:MAG: hypothetical protein Q8900_06745 [Bacillota bacterium]|nr:hypothetical protein [Bacillota bacterium]
MHRQNSICVAFSFISISSPNFCMEDDEVEKEYVRRVNEEGAKFNPFQSY